MKQCILGTGLFPETYCFINFYSVCNICKTQYNVTKTYEDCKCDVPS
jgi:hypothetical protein